MTFFYLIVLLSGVIFLHKLKLLISSNSKLKQAVQRPQALGFLQNGADYNISQLTRHKHLTTGHKLSIPC